MIASISTATTKKTTVPKTVTDVHERHAVRPVYFPSSTAPCAYNAQEMVHRSVIPMIVHRQPGRAERKQLRKSAAEANRDKLTLDPELEIPRSVSDIDVHLTPGSYHSEYAENDAGLPVRYTTTQSMCSRSTRWVATSMTSVTTMSNYICVMNFPDFKPERILDCGCTIGCNTLPWKADLSPEAEVTRYRCECAVDALWRQPVRPASTVTKSNFAQMNATSISTTPIITSTWCSLPCSCMNCRLRTFVPT